ncbi:MerR family transcriptional regulator [Paenibacillus hemerocallicola]|uniref:MerR family transcriptional regulator n=1 Tax=Paenibacillus hemerocallicola TaxID=1172614 RepID=A0A5C4T4X7_9BACL|nr:MerR family transcriptional regulator [Paenibacillus hemerocallicola]TNJ63377.1 MerR family transcriptional regulator [Paenibacillus hemerocallicola]
MDTLISIGEMSSSMGISIRAIRYYEEIGLLVPSKTSENNYRFYSDLEKGKLGIILILKKMGLSLREIKTVFNGIEPDSFIHLLDEHIERLQKDKAEILLKQEVLETVLSHFKGDPLEALREVSMKKTDEINDLLRTKSLVKVIGVGCHINVLEGLKCADKNLEIIHIGYEEEPLSNSRFSKSIQLQGSSYEIGIQEEIHRVRKAIEDAELLFILTHVDNGIASTIAQEAQKLGIHTVGIINDSPMGNGVNHRVQELINHVDLLFDFSESTSNSHEDIIVDSVVYLSSLILKTHIHIRDIQTLIKKKGRAYLSFGRASGLNKIAAVMEQIFSNSFLHKKVIEDTSCALLNITASDDLTIPDVDQVLNIVRNKIGYKTNLIFGTVIDNEVNDDIIVTLILTGFDKKEESSSDENVETLITRKHVIV